jgi:hypothetical protein
MFSLFIQFLYEIALCVALCSWRDDLTLKNLKGMEKCGKKGLVVV